MGLFRFLFGWLFTSPRGRDELPPPEVEITDEFYNVLRSLEGTRSPIFVTGKAGTGKSTLLRHFCNTTRKNVVTVAPTGMAAINVRGVTIHSFFRFPPTLLQDKDIKINPLKQDVLKNVDAIVIDEISMVRADTLDAIDTSLRLHRSTNKPFGGIQMVFLVMCASFLPLWTAL